MRSIRWASKTPANVRVAGKIPGIGCRPKEQGKSRGTGEADVREAVWRIRSLKNIGTNYRRDTSENNNAGPVGGRGKEVKIGVLVFPGSNCDHDCEHVFHDVLGRQAEMIWHKETMVFWTGRDYPFRAAFPMGTTCGREPFTVLAGDECQFQRVCPKQAGSSVGHLQRISDSPRGRIASRGGCCGTARSISYCKMSRCAGRKCCHFLSLVHASPARCSNIPVAHKPKGITIPTLWRWAGTTGQC